MKQYPIIQLDETVSTNQELTQLCDRQGNDLAEFTTLCADFQTAGKGQRGNSWESEPGKNLLFSFVLFPRFLEAKRQFVLSQVISLAIKEELEEIIRPLHATEEEETDGRKREASPVSIKWPNDIYWREKKICGILIENDLQGRDIRRCIAGIGININQEVFLSDAPNPCSLKQITGKEHPRQPILQRILQRVEAYYRQLKQEDISQEITGRYARSLFRREGYHPYQDANGRFLARLLQVEPDGRFVLEDEAGKVRKYLFKEVEYRSEGDKRG